MEPTDENLRAWERAHRPTEVGETSLPAQVRESLADLAGKRVLHVACGTGAATVEFAELGASVTGVDASDGALERARERGPSVLWIHGDPGSLPTELQRGRFDLVYAGPGTSQSVADLDLFAGSLGASLRAGGDVLLFDEHPSALCLDGLMHWREDYFDASFRRLGEVVGAFARHGLVTRALEEYPAGAGSYHDSRVPEHFLLHARKAR